MIDSKIANNPDMNKLKKEKDFLYQKIKDIDHITDIY